MTCDTCLGRGSIVTCVDDLCHADGDDSECIHGDGHATCPHCQGDGTVAGEDDD